MLLSKFLEITNDKFTLLHAEINGKNAVVIFNFNNTVGNGVFVVERTTSLEIDDKELLKLEGVHSVF